MTLKAEQVLAAFNTKLQTLVPGSLTTVYRQMPYSYSNAVLPALNIVMGTDTPIEAVPTNLTYQDWRLTVYVDVILKSSTVPLETTHNAIRLAVHQTIMADYTLGLAWVITTVPGQAEQPTLVSEGEEPVSVARLSFNVDYRTQVTDPSA